MNSCFECKLDTLILCNYEILMNHMPVKSSEKNKKGAALIWHDIVSHQHQHHRDSGQGMDLGWW